MSSQNGRAPEWVFSWSQSRERFKWLARRHAQDLNVPEPVLERNEQGRPALQTGWCPVCGSEAAMAFKEDGGLRCFGRPPCPPDLVREVLEGSLARSYWKTIDDQRKKDEGQKAGALLRLYGPEELGHAPPPLEPLIQGVAARGSFGPFGGKEKTLKTHLVYGFAVAVASGRKAFGYWNVPKALPVLICAGEGGIDLTRRRLQRVARDLYGIEDISKLPLYVIAGIADMTGEEFQWRLRAAREQARDLALVILDSLYNFHPPRIEVQNLYARGGMLSEFQHKAHGICGEKCTIWAVDHFRKSANTTNLDEYQQSGMGAWADSWFNLEHRENPNLDENFFQLNATVGSRQGWAGLYELDVRLGPFDEERMVSPDPMTVQVRRVPEHKHVKKGDLSDARLDEAILEVVDSGEFTRTQVKQKLPGRTARKDERLDWMLANDVLRVAAVRRVEPDGRKMRRNVLKRHAEGQEQLPNPFEAVPSIRPRPEERDGMPSDRPSLRAIPNPSHGSG